MSAFAFNDDCAMCVESPDISATAKASFTTSGCLALHVGATAEQISTHGTRTEQPLDVVKASAGAYQSFQKTSGIAAACILNGRVSGQCIAPVDAEPAPECLSPLACDEGRRQAQLLAQSGATAPPALVDVLNSCSFSDGLVNNETLAIAFEGHFHPEIDPLNDPQPHGIATRG